MRKPRKTMGQPCEFDPTDATAGAWRHETAAPTETRDQIDLDRVVWDPEYRDQVLETLRTTD